MSINENEKNGILEAQILSPEAIQLLRKLIAREQEDTRVLFEVSEHWPKAEREQLEQLVDNASIKPLVELENHVRGQELLSIYKQKAEAASHEQKSKTS